MKSLKNLDGYGGARDVQNVRLCASEKESKEKKEEVMQQNFSSDFSENRRMARKALPAMRTMIGSHRAVVSHSNPFLVLISTVLSQRTKDANTDKASAALFQRFRTPKQLASADLRSIEKLIKPSGFYKVKARRIKRIAKIILEKHRGQTPKSIDELIKLPGVGRKTANCVLVYGFGMAALPVDTHVHRISNRLSIVRTKTPEQTENWLSQVVPKNEWLELNDLMVKFGQQVCKPINPLCNICLLNKACPTGLTRMKKSRRKTE